MTTDQRLCAVRFCGHPESSHFCEDEGGSEPYHGDDWCGDCAGPGTAHEFKPPTPSSLEEAQPVYTDDDRFYARLHIGYYGDWQNPHEVTFRVEAPEAMPLVEQWLARWAEQHGYVRSTESDVKAAARAEVIREVEALRRPYTPYNEDERDADYDAGYDVALDDVIARLRALSQGEEGKA